MKHVKDELAAADQVIAEDMKFRQDMEDSVAEVSEKLPYKTENHNLVADHDNEPAMSDVIENVSIPGSPRAVNHHAGTILSPESDALFKASFDSVPAQVPTIQQKPRTQRSGFFFAKKPRSRQNVSSVPVAGRYIYPRFYSTATRTSGSDEEDDVTWEELPCFRF